MSYGTSIRLPYGSIYLNKMSIKGLYDLESEIDDASDSIQHVKEKLKMLASATPKDLYPNEEDVLFSLNRDFDDLWELLEEDFQKKHRLQLVLDEIDLWKGEHKDDLGEIVEESLDPDKSEDWAKITGERYNTLIMSSTCKAFSLDNLDSQIGNQITPYLFEKERLKGKYVLYYKDKLYHTINNLFLFSTEESALNHFFRGLDLNLSSLAERKYIVENRQFLSEELAKFLDDDEKRKEYEELLDEVSKQDEKNYATECQLYDYIKMAVDNYIKQFIRIIQL